MKVTIDLKTLVIGIVIGIAFAFALGARGTGAEFGFSVPSGGRAIIKTDNTEGYVVDTSTGRAVPIRFADGEDLELF